MNLFDMMQSLRPTPQKKRWVCDMAKRSATFKAKRIAKWGAVFAEYGGRAGTNVLAGHMGRGAPSILKSMYDLESEGLVFRAGVVLKSGPGKSQIIWEWRNAD